MAGRCADGEVCWADYASKAERGTEVLQPLTRQLFCPHAKKARKCFLLLIYDRETKRYVVSIGAGRDAFVTEIASLVQGRPSSTYPCYYPDKNMKPYCCCETTSPQQLDQPQRTQYLTQRRALFWLCECEPVASHPKRPHAIGQCRRKRQTSSRDAMSLLA